MPNAIKFFFKKYQTPAIIFIVSRALIFITLFLISLYGFVGVNGSHASINQWDAGHYLCIAEHGYDFTASYTFEKSCSIAFFPLYPLVVHIFHVITRIPFWFSGPFLSFGFSLGAALILYRLACDWKGKDVAWSAVALYSFYPASIFLASDKRSSFLDGRFGIRLGLKHEKGSGESGRFSRVGMNGMDSKPRVLKTERSELY